MATKSLHICSNNIATRCATRRYLTDKSSEWLQLHTTDMSAEIGQFLFHNARQPVGGGRPVRFGPKMGKIGSKWVKTGTFSYQIFVHFDFAI